MAGTTILNLYAIAVTIFPGDEIILSAWYYWYPVLLTRGFAEWIFIIGVVGVTR